MTESETTTTAEALAGLRDALDRVAAAGATAEELEQKTASAEAECLDQLRNLLTPVLRYIDQPVPIYRYHSGHERHEWEETCWEQHALPLTRTTLDPDRTLTDRDYRGNYTGQVGILARDGSLRLASFSGSWSNWRGEPSRLFVAIDPAAGAAEMLAATEATLADVLHCVAAQLQDAIARAETGRRTLAGVHE